MVDAPAPSRPPVLTRPNLTSFFEDELPTPWTTENNVHAWLPDQMSVNDAWAMHPIITIGTWKEFWKEFGGTHEDKSQNDLCVSQLA